ncbi:MAG: hypothetical protein ONB44_01050 [candidate division KSB1 bacterium]|nr:hypothetical protein [candidate division KSB1 bacterium]MDZ7300707.1 hypothetical protein [candidate division KSB1 bacterium]MDZ7310023.1 hypothetical protein [candidate division KSB1 bacterium]
MRTNNRTPHPTLRLSDRLRKNLFTITILGILITAVGLVVAPARTWPNILLANYYLMGLGIAGALFMALLYVSNAGWATAIRRVPEAMTAALPPSALVMIAILFGIPTLYEWSHDSVLAADRILQAKSGWLNVPFFTVRTFIYLAVWLALTYRIVRRSHRQDEDGKLEHTFANRKLSAAFIVVFAITFTLASMDWIMSLQPHWYSTIFGIYNFSGMFLNGLAMITVLVILLRRWGPLAGVVTDSHLHDLGKLIFAFSTFWMYIWFSQYLLIWYANIPEEVRFYTLRERGGWLVLTIVNVLFNWVIPFVTLLPVWVKRNEGLLLRVCIIVMIGHWIDLFWMILPPFMKATPAAFLWEIAPMAAAVAGFFLLTFHTLTRHRLLPVNDPYLVESLAESQHA